MGDWHGIGVRPNAARRKAAVVAVLLATTLCVACAGGSGVTASSRDESAQDAHAGAPRVISTAEADSEQPAAAGAAGGETLPTASLGVGMISCPAAFSAWATETSGLDVDTVDPTASPRLPEAWKVGGLGAPSCAFSGVRDGADPLTGKPRRMSNVVLAYLSESASVLEAAYADARTVLEASSLTFASESSDAGLHAAQYFDDDAAGVVDATLTVTMRIKPPFAADAGLESGVGLLIVRATHRVELPDE